MSGWGPLYALGNRRGRGRSLDLDHPSPDAPAWFTPGGDPISPTSSDCYLPRRRRTLMVKGSLHDRWSGESRRPRLP